jgi:phosphatidylglycerol lysyltransferase
MLAIFLVPWTVLLALPISRSWFPSEAVRWAWVAFDVAVGIALYRLSGRWNPRLANVLIVAIAMDAILTATQAILYDLPRHGTPWALAVIAVAVLAPTVAVMLLSAGRSHRLRLV